MNNNWIILIFDASLTLDTLKTIVYSIPVDTVDFSGLAFFYFFIYMFRTCFDQQISLFTLLDRASFLHYNNTKIIKFGWELFILWVISYGLSFSGFARFPEFRGTINDSFSSICANTYQHSTSYKEISVPMTCLDCKSLLGNTKELQTQAPWQYTDHWTQYSLNLWTAEAVINRASELWKSGKSRKWQSI